MSSTANSDVAIGWHFIVLMSRQGKIRLSEFFSSYSESEKRRILRDIAADVLPRQPKMCNIIEKGEFKFVYRRYASLYFIVGVPVGMNELLVLEQIHLFVEALDGYFNSGTLYNYYYYQPITLLNFCFYCYMYVRIIDFFCFHDSIVCVWLVGWLVGWLVSV